MREIRTITEEEILIATDFLKDKGYEHMPLDKNLAYVKPLKYISHILCQHFPYLLIMKQSEGGQFVIRTYYHIFRKDMLLELANFFGFDKKNIFDAKPIENIDYIRNIPCKILKEIAIDILNKYPVNFTGTLMGTGHIPRKILNMRHWNAEQNNTLKSILPYAQTSVGTFYKSNGLNTIMKMILQYIKARWQIEVPIEILTKEK